MRWGCVNSVQPSAGYGLPDFVISPLRLRPLRVQPDNAARNNATKIGVEKMSEMVKIENLKSMIIEIRGHDVLLDSDVAQIYGVETRDINKAVANNPDKFPTGYIVVLSKPEKTELVENFHRFEKLKHSTVNPKAFTEKGLYMLATIHNPGNSLGRHSGEGRNPARTKIPQSGQRENM
jgi:predicted RecB family endonuclease